MKKLWTILLCLLIGCANMEQSRKIVCAGDSITYGYLLDEEDSYFYLLQQMCSNDELLNTSTVGITAYDYLQSSLLKKAKKFKPDVVILMFGSNDSNLDYWESEETFTQYYEALIDEFKDSIIYLCTPPTPYSSNYGVNANNVKKIVKCIKKIGKKRNCTVIDIYTLTANHSEWFIDGVHPNKDGSQAIADAIYAEIKR